jgi:hypothetical protein
MKTYLLPLILTASLSSQAAITLSDVETAMDGAGFSDSVYLDLQDSAFTNSGITLTWANHTAGDWGYPDASDNATFVEGFGLDEKNGPAPVEAVFSGLDANSQYTFWTTLLIDTSDTQSRDFSWGLSYDGGQPGGGLTTVVPALSYDNISAPYTDQVPIATGSNLSTGASILGTFTTDGSGNFTIWLGPGGSSRTQLDGMIVTPVPEPATFALLAGMGAFGLILIRRRLKN